MAFHSLTNINIPLLSLPLYYVLAIYPHGHAVIKASQGQLNKYDNRNPRSTTHHEKVRKKLGVKEFAAWERSESCHKNAMENMPLFMAAIFAGMFAERKGVMRGQMGLDEFAVGWLVLRVLYTVVYLRAETVRWSYLRSLLYFASSGWAFFVIGHAALVVGR